METLRDFDRFYNEHVDLVYRFSLRMTGNRCDAEDLCQDTFLAAYRGFADFRGESQHRTWLLGICHHKATKLLRRRKLERLFRQSRTEPEFTESIALERMILELPQTQREAFLLVKVEGLTADEAADVLRVPAGTVKFRVHKAVMALRSEFLGNRSLGEEVHHAS